MLELHLHFRSPLRGEFTVKDYDIPLCCILRSSVRITLHERLVNVILGVDVLSPLSNKVTTTEILRVD